MLCLCAVNGEAAAWFRKWTFQRARHESQTNLQIDVARNMRQMRKNWHSGAVRSHDLEYCLELMLGSVDDDEKLSLVRGKNVPVGYAGLLGHMRTSVAAVRCPCLPPALPVPQSGR